MMHPTPYPDLNTVLAALLDRVQAVVADAFVGLYLQGSFAVGDFDEHSDVDFIVAMSRQLTAEQVAALNHLHDTLFEMPIPWARHLEGSYFPPDVLRDYARAGEPVWYVDHGARFVIESDHCNTALVRWVVREQGVTLAGPPPATLIDPVPVDVLRDEMRAVILDWGAEILANPEHFRNRFYQGFILLSYCRMLHDLINERPGSKLAGATWAKTHFDPAWHGLIDRAWDTRPDPATSVRTRPDPADFAATLDFVRLVMAEARTV